MYTDLIKFLEIKRIEIEKEFDLVEERIRLLKRDVQASINEIEERIKRQKYH